VVPQKKVEFIEQLALTVGQGIIKFKMTDDILRSNDLLEKIISTSNFLMAYFDSNLNFIKVNDAFAALEGKTPGYFAGRGQADTSFTRQKKDLLQKVAATGKPYFAYEESFTSSGGPGARETFWDVNVQPVTGASEKVEGFLMTLVDKTERRRTREKLIEKEKELVQAKRLSDIGTLAATVAHELRNPLATIKMAAYNIKKKSQSPELSRHLSNIDKKIAESDGIINNLAFLLEVEVREA